MTMYAKVPSPLGELLLAADNKGLCQLTYENHRHPRLVLSSWQEKPEAFIEIRQQLDAYFAGKRKTFDIPLSLKGTVFQLEVWKALQELPYGSTISYGALAKRIGRPRAVRALGAAVGRNPVSILVPCHRVVGSDGSLTGYAGGVERKEWLLHREGVENR